MGIKKKTAGWLLMLLFVLVLTGCGDAKKPEEREKATVTPAESNEKPTSTDVPEVTPTDVPEVTPTDVPEVTPTDVPEVTPTDAPEVTPTDVPEVTPTDVPEVTPTDVPKVTPTDVPEVTPTSEVTPTAVVTETPELTPTAAVTATPTAIPTSATTATPTPTVAPTSAVTATPMPTPVAELPKVAAEPGPQYTIGNADWYQYSMDQTDANVGFHTDFLYLIEPNYSYVMDRIADVNVAHGNACYEAFIAAVDAGESEDVSKWCYIDRCEQIRSDTAVLSFARSVVTYTGGAHENRIRYGFNFETKTGNVLSLRDMVTDYDRLAEIVTAKLEADPKYTDSFMDEDWKANVRQMFREDSVSWLATQYGLEIWIPEGRVAAYAVGEVCAKVNIAEYPDLFVKQYVGDYTNSFSKKTLNCASYRTETYNKLVTQYIRGIGSMSWKEAVSVAKNANAPYSGKDEKEAMEEESNAYLTVTDVADGARIQLYFTSYTENDVQRLTSITLEDHGAYIFIDNAYGLTSVRYTIREPWMEVNAQKTVPVAIKSADELSMLYFVTVPDYYNTRYNKHD